MKKTKTLFDQAIEIIEGGGDVKTLLNNCPEDDQYKFFEQTVCPISFYEACTLLPLVSYEIYNINVYTRLLLARELWNDGQEKYWKAGLFK